MIATILITTCLWLTGIAIGYRFTSKTLLVLWYFSFFASSLNAIYYLHFLDHSSIYYTYRSWPWADFTPAASGFLIGSLFSQHKSHARWMAYLTILAALIFMATPWIKPLLIPLNSFENPRWYRNVCMQTSFSTCGPCSAVNVLKKYGVNITEAEAATACMTSETGTELWYIARYIRSLGLHADFINDANHIPSSSIIGLDLGGTGHFVTVLSVNENHIEIADSCQGPVSITFDKLISSYHYSGLALVISP